jgi:hypothetical protein
MRYPRSGILPVALPSARAILVRPLILLFGLVGLAGSVQAETAAPLSDDAAVEKRLADTARYLSSDELEGRGPGTKGIELAREYIAQQFREIGLQMDACGGSPFQPFSVTTGARLGTNNWLTLTGPSLEGGKVSHRELVLGKQYTPLGASDSVDFDLPLVFVGYGITDMAAGYDDYAGVDVAGKAVLMLRHEAHQGKTAPATGDKCSRHALVRRKMANAFEHGAAAIVLLTDKADLVAREMRMDPLLKMTSGGLRCTHPGTAVFHCRRAVAEPAIRAVYGMDLAALEAEIDHGPTPHSRALTGWRIAGHSDVQRVQFQANNVIGILPGAAPKSGETIVVGAHYDHFGYKDIESEGKKIRAIYSGADDNASGVSAMIEIARCLAHQPHPLARRMVFVAFSAEEEGLLGSSYYVGHPVAPLDRTIAMFNLDMVGRLDHNRLHVRGTFTAVDWVRLLQNLDIQHGLTLDMPSNAFGSSDQLAFYAKEVPIIAFFTGRHEDYHEPTDKFAKLNVPGMRRITQLAEDFLVTIADAPARPKYIAAVPPEDTEPYFGAFGDFTRTDGGFALGPVAQGGPAAKAGLRDGDVVVKIDDSRIASEDDFNEAITHYRGGQRMSLTVKRGGVAKTLYVTLSSPSHGGKDVGRQLARQTDPTPSRSPAVNNAKSRSSSVSKL